jgi:hypothetical protein
MTASSKMDTPPYANRRGHPSSTWHLYPHLLRRFQILTPEAGEIEIGMNEKQKSKK